MPLASDRGRKPSRSAAGPADSIKAAAGIGPADSYLAAARQNGPLCVASVHRYTKYTGPVYKVYKSVYKVYRQVYKVYDPVYREYKPVYSNV